MPAPDTQRPGFPILWILLFGVLAVAAFQEPAAFWPGALCGYLFGRQRRAEHDLRVLEARLDAALKAAAGADRPPPAAIEVPRPVTRPAEQAAPVPAAVPPIAAAAGGEKRPEPALPPASPSVFDTAFNRLLDWARGGNPLARLGVVITFIGAVYLIRYAAEAGWLPVELRLAGLSLAALAMVATGWRLRDKVTSYALTLQGGGLALLYLTVLAALRLYRLLPPTPAFVLLVLVAAASAGLAVRQNALPLAIIGFAGGFVAPLMIGGDGSHLLLFGYYTVLNLGVFAVAAFRGWTLLNLLGFTFTFVITSLWRATAYRPEWFASFEFFLLLYFAMYVAVTVLSARSGRRRGVVPGTLTFGLPAIVLSLQASLVVGIERGLAISAAGLGGFYLLLAAILLRRGQAHERTLAQAFLAIGVVLSSLAVPLYWDDQATAATWALEGAGAVWLGLRQRSRWTLGFGVVIQLLAGVSLLIAIDTAGAGSGRFATGLPGALLLSAAGFASACWLRLADPDVHRRGMPIGFAIWALAWWLFAGLAQIDHADSAWALGLTLGFGALTTALLISAARYLAWSTLMRLSQAVSALFACGGLLDALAERPSSEGGAIGWLLLFAVHYRSLQHAERRADAPPEAAAHVIPALLAAWLGSLEMAWHLHDRLGGDWPFIAWGLGPAATLGLILLLPRRWPLVAHRPLYAGGVAAPLALWLLGWIVFGALHAEGNAAPLVTLPLLNPLDLSVLAVAMLLLRGWRRRDPEDWRWLARLPIPRASTTLVPTLAAIAAFAWLNGALVRGLHYSQGTPLKGSALLDSALLQAAFSVLWSLLGCGAMWWAARRRSREIWLAGAALMVVVAIKLFAVDTAGTGTLARIAAFLFVGAILLAAGYLAPLPSESARDR